MRRRSADLNIHEVVQGSPGADGGFHPSESFRLAVCVTHPIQLGTVVRARHCRVSRDLRLDAVRNSRNEFYCADPAA